MYRIEDKDNPDYNSYDIDKNPRVTKEQSDNILRKYYGWGGLSQVFDERYKNHENTRKEIKELIGEQDYAKARRSTLNAFYTPQIIIDAMYKAVINMELPADSRVLEPSCGTGNFITRIPSRYRNAEITGVEIDATTAKIASYLANDNKNVKILNMGYEKTHFENESFDLVIGNVPFGENKMIDAEYNKDLLIHDAFFRKSLDKVKKGGIVAFITTSGTLDKKNSKIREMLAEKADLVGAIRLPNNAFNINHSKINTTAMQLELKKQENEIAMLKKEKESPFMSFYYSDSEKQLYVQRELDEREIEYRETDNGFEAKKIHLKDIRRIENSFTPEKENFRDKLRDDIDRAVLKSQNINELVNYLQQLHYEVKQGKYISARPPKSERFIRLKSLGEFYSEEALRNRIIQRQGYEADIERQLKECEKKQTETIVLRTTISYFRAFTLYDFSMNKVNKNKHFSWENDAVLDNLASINKRINEGATIDTFRNECTDINSEIQEAEKAIDIAKKNLEMYSKMHTCARIIYGNREATDKNYDIAKQVMELHPEVTKDNYMLMPQAMKTENERINDMEKKLNSTRALLKEKSATLSTVEKIMGETYIQSLMENEFLKKASEFVPNGLISM